MSYRGAGVVQTSESVAKIHGRSKRTRVDQGPEFISTDMGLLIQNGLTGKTSIGAKPAFSRGRNSSTEI